MDHKTVEEYILSMPNSWLDHPFGESVAVYKTGPKDDAHMFALITEGKDPVQLSVKCAPELAIVLRETYDEVMPGYHLNKKHWNTIVLAGQTPWDEVQGFIRHSYHLVAGTH
ncbi:MAG: MmcQ/YjbR family DNA-binding protein [Patescibacteria group bacterium]|nr:MmcQ/YjbR family DNA-binding protein [Patescibacteria group bacterium]